MVRATCGWKVVDRKTNEEQMNMLGLKEIVNGIATVNGVRWYGYVVRRDDYSDFGVSLDLEANGKRKQRR